MTDNETPTEPFDSVTWNVTLTAFDWDDEHKNWTTEKPLDKYELTFDLLYSALEYQRSWTTDAARTLMEEAGCTALEVAVHKQFFEKGEFLGRLPFVSVTTFELVGDSIECEKYYEEEDVRSSRW